MERPCPNDAARIPQVAEVLSGAEPVRFFWCRYCSELFGFVGDPPNERLAARFACDRGNRWRIWRREGAEDDVLSAVEAVVQVPLQV